MTPGLLSAVPFVSVAGFKAHPTYLDLQNLRSADSSAPDQDVELLNILAQASNWAENGFCHQPLQAHLQQDTARVRPSRNGDLVLYPSHTPVRRLISYQYQAGIGQPAVSAVNPSYWMEDNRQLIVNLGGPGFQSWGPGPLQFNQPMSGQELYTTWQYVAGFCNTLLAVTVAPGASSITVTDPTGLEPGDVVRIWDPGKEEVLVVSPSYTPVPVYPPVQTSIPLVSPVMNAHTASTTAGLQVSVSNLPADAYLGIVYLGIDILQRFGSSDPKWPGMAVPSATVPRDVPSNTWMLRAMELLAPYQDVR